MTASASGSPIQRLFERGDAPLDDRSVESLRIALRVAADISAHATESPSRPACGLLIGRRDASSAWVERSLPCVNVADDPESSDAFAIDPRVLVNVRNTLAPTPREVVGFYYATSDAAAELSTRDLELLRLQPGMVLIIRGPRDIPAPIFRAWSQRQLDPTPAELEIEFVQAAPARLVCPD